VNFLSQNFPSNDLTDGQYLYRSLGSFWTSIFKDKAALRGYTTGMAEELIQQYYDLTEVIKKHSVKDIEILHKDKWLPLIIKKSKFNSVKLLFEQNSAVFGKQSESDAFYADLLFRFGLPKEALGGKFFAFDPENKLKKVGLIANKIIAPSLALLPGVDFIFKDNVLFFNTDLFENEYIPKAKIVEEYGRIAQYTDNSGKIHDDEFIVLWAYNAETDQQALQPLFGNLFDLKLESSESYKEILKALMNLTMEGPTIAALSQAFSALVGVPVVSEKEEVIEQIYDSPALRSSGYSSQEQMQQASSVNSKNCLPEYYKYIVTDKNVYRLHNLQPLAEYIKLGEALHIGQPLSSQIKLIDTVIDPIWWRKELADDKLVLPSYIFAADIGYSLFFENTESFIEYTDERITFPVQGKPEDVKKFNDYINHPERKTQILGKLNFPNKKSARISINPLEFVFDNFFKNNTLLLKIEFYCEEQMQLFLNLFDDLKKYLPPHVFIFVKLNIKLGYEQINNWNSSFIINNEFCSIDGGSVMPGKIGARPGAISDEDYYKDYSNKLFCVSISPHKYESPTSELPLPLYSDGNLPVLFGDNSSASSSLPGIRAGLLRTEIPTSIYIPAEDREITPTTREIPSILLIDF
jgi:hypothetical protein